ncbi:MAG: ABC transporter ATP-binding protein [Muribaculaceae bacterium]|nr:ABC transporter ATP-binding protein [Muribaculaceae bacterium]
MIEISHVSKSYGQLTVLHDVTLSIPEGEIMAIVGPSGAGKTTLLQIAGTLDMPDSGSVLFDGVDVLKLKDKKLSAFRNRNIGFVFQFHQLLPEFSALENVAIPAFIAGRKKKEAMDEARRLLETLGMGDRLTHKPAQLSGGEKQRTAIARALINQPRVVFADEPTGSLDSRNRDEIQAIIANLRDELRQTFVMVTHDPAMASIADRTVTMTDGRLIESESAVEGQPSAEAEE